MTPKNNQNQCNLQLNDYKLYVSRMDANQFKQIFIDSFLYETIAPAGNLESRIKFLFSLSTALGGTDHLLDEQKYIALHFIEDLYSTAKLIQDSGSIENIEAQILFDHVVDSGIIDNILDIDELMGKYWVIFSIMSYMALDELAFNKKERDTLTALLESYLSFIDKIIKSSSVANGKD